MKRMQTISLPDQRHKSWCAAVMLMLLGAGAANAQVVSQSPLTVGGGVPGNMVLTPSVEFPTLNSKANLGNYVATTAYTGYFDSYKCYKYSYNATESLRHFYPFRTTAALAVCSAAALEWSGNWLNWATTQTIDPFRKALTGGYRVRDTATETWLEKARHDGQGGAGYFPLATVTGSGTIAGAVASPNWATLKSRVFGANAELYITSTATDTVLSAATTAAGSTTAYDPATHFLNNTAPNPTTVWRLSVRVKVCDSTVGLEANCEQYASGYKPAGLIQKYSRKIRFSVFGYLLDNGAFRDGGVLRANQKFVGPELLNRVTRLWEANPNKEWNDDGVFFDNPNPTDAAATQSLVNGATVTHPIRYSGVINYINRFAQLTGTNAKNYDPVSELYYTATRYLRGRTPVSTYSDLTLRYTTSAGVATTVGADRFNLTDGFPVITNWDDPYQYACQSSAILGIGDVYTHKDKNLKGNTASFTNEPSTMPADVSSDPFRSLAGHPTNGTIVEWTQRAYTMEGVAYNVPLSSGLNNSPYMVGLAYYMHTQDIRPEAALPDEQTVSTHWVDVRETQKIEPRVRNQYWMAAKYGGFAVPDDYNALTRTTALPTTWWSTTGDNVTSNSTDWPNETFRRASNYYVADRPSTMVDSLTRAFAKIVSERSGSGASLAANSTRLDTDTRTYQAQFRSGAWLGQLAAYSFNVTTGDINPTPIWRAGERVPAWASRNIWVHNPTGLPSGEYVQFRYNNLSVDQKAAMNAINTVIAPATGQDVVDYIRGSQLKEQSQTAGTLRTRTSPEPGWSPILGDIVNSTPTFVGAPNRNLFSRLPGTWPGKDTYSSFADAQASRLPVVWVGANDGMLHAFNALDTSPTVGAEIYAYVPNAAVMSGLATFADPDYEHRYFVDGDIAVTDVYDTGSSTWRTILVSTMGRGGPGVFALDVTDPTDVQFLWERNTSDIAGLGHNIGRPVIAQIANGDWRVLFGNGPDSAAGTAKLIMIGVLSGDATVVDTDGTTGNGLTAVLSRDNDLDGLFEDVYAGDLQGNLWKFNDVAGAAAVTKLFEATDGTNPQPITAAPTVGKDPATGATWVWFGTGKYLAESDLIDEQMQSWYGFKDTDALVTRAQLLQRQFTLALTERHGFALRTLTQAVAGDLASYQGWYIDFPEARERMVVPNILVGSALVGTTRTPNGSDACAPSGSSWLMAINPFTGARLPSNFFDISKDGEFTDDDDTNEGDLTSAIQLGNAANGPLTVPPNLCVTQDNGEILCLKYQTPSTNARRGSWREVTN
jgi:type IV pilus assembly protein PilY1